MAKRKTTKQEETTYYMMIKPDKVLAKQFKAWCKGQKIPMARVINLLMQHLVDGDFTLKQKLEKNKI